MRIPTYDGPRAQVSDAPLRAPRVPVEGGREALDQALSEGGRAIDQGLSVLSRNAEEAKQKAIAKDTTDGETDLTNYATEKFHGTQGSGNPTRDSIEEAFTGQPAATKGYLNTKGDEAFQASAEVFDDLKKKRREIADNMSTPEARDLFLQRTARQMDGYFETVETHAGHQRQIANLATIEARKGAALEAIRANPNNLTEVETQANALNGPIQTLGLSTEDRKAKVAEWHGQVAAEQISSQLEAGDWKSAETTLTNKKALLPDKAQKALGAAVEKQRAAAESEVQAGQLVSSATNERGEVNQAAVIAKLNALPGDDQKRLRPIVYQRMTEQEQAYAADTKRVSTAAHSLYNKVGWTAFSAQPIADELNARNPELYNRLQNDGQSEADRLARKKRDTKEDRRAQQNIDTIALNTYLGLPPDERAETDTEMWAKGRGMSPVAVSSLLKLKETARQTVERGQSASESEFVKRAIADAEGTLPTGTDPKSKGRRHAQEIAIEAEARRWYSQWVVDHEGKPPTDKDIAEKSGKIAAGHVPIGDAGAAQQADVIIRQGTQREMVLPELDFSGAGGPPPAGPPSAAAGGAAPKGTGVFKTDKNGVRWEKMSDGSARRVN